MGGGELGADPWAPGAPGRPPRELYGSLLLHLLSFGLTGVIDPVIGEFVIISADYCCRSCWDPGSLGSVSGPAAKIALWDFGGVSASGGHAHLFKEKRKNRAESKPLHTWRSGLGAGRTALRPGSNLLGAGRHMGGSLGIRNGWEEHRWRPCRVECAGSLPTSRAKRRRARLVLGRGTALEDLRVLSAFPNAAPPDNGQAHRSGDRKAPGGGGQAGPVQTTGCLV